jgi:phytoene dehydrogenase-like protein
MSPIARRKIHLGHNASDAGLASDHRGGDGEPGRATVVGSGPNGLAAAIVLARAGWSVAVREAADVPGGGVRSESLTLPGFLHDLASAVHPLALSSPLFRDLPLAAHGLEWVHPTIPLAHPLDDGPAVALRRSVGETAGGLGSPDGQRYRAFVGPFVERWTALCDDILGPLPPFRWPAHPMLLARFAGRAVPSASVIARTVFRGERVRALFGGLAAHSVLPLTALGTSAIGLVLGLAGHAVGWPVPRGGAGALATALVRYLSALGGTLDTSSPVRSLSELVGVDAIVLDLTPRQVLAIAGRTLPGGVVAGLTAYRYGPGVFKIDWALSAPIPWRDPVCADAVTVHLGGTFAEVETSEAAPWRGEHAERPFVLLVQPSLFDHSRAPPGRHTAWAYCHVPNASSVDMTSRIEAQIERFAPGFRDVVLARSVMSPARLEAYDANLVGGDISGGANLLRQIVFRPIVGRAPYRLGVDGVYLCSSSTPPGGGVHGMCGYHAAQAVLADRARRTVASRRSTRQ